MKVHRTQVILRPDAGRVLFRPFDTHNTSRTVKIIARIMALSEERVAELHRQVMSEFHGRHQRLKPFFHQRFAQIRHFLLSDEPLSELRQELIGAYFTQEYSLESAALFNPSMVWHPDQTGVEDGSRRFIVSLRATGEGHISSITFRTGIVDSRYQIHIDPVTQFVAAPEVAPDASYDKVLFRRKLFELDGFNEFAQRVLDRLGGHFNLGDLISAIDVTKRMFRAESLTGTEAASTMLALAEANYEIHYDAGQELSECIIFPTSPNERKGIEDARFVAFSDDSGTRYLATYTAYDGSVTLPQLLETKDFLRFKINTLNGPQVHNKGLALFPRKLGENYAMVSRQDGENIYLMYSDSLHFWYTRELIIKPTYPWEFVQLGNCGSPIETPEGWILLSHGVGPMRKYSLSAYLLDLEDPSRVLGRLKEPLITPDENEREGYVPNVVYSCGGVLFGERLIIPYAMSDYASSFVTVGLAELIDELKANRT